MQCLYNHGADINIPNLSVHSRLQYPREILWYLLEIGAGINQATPEGYTAMHIVAAATGGGGGGLASHSETATEVSLPSLARVPRPKRGIHSLSTLSGHRQWQHLLTQELESSPECLFSCKWIIPLVHGHHAFEVN